MRKILMIDDTKQPEWFKYHFDINDDEPFKFNDENTTIARTGEEGMQLLGAWKWDVLLLDHDLGMGMNGMDVLKKLANMDDLIPPTIILITNNIIAGPNMMHFLGDMQKHGMIEHHDWIRA